MKSFLIWAEKKGYCKNKDYKLFHPGKKDADKRNNYIALTKQECDVLENYTFPKEYSHLEAARDVLIFSCYSGLRFSDIKRLRWLDVKDDFLEITELKTGNSYHLYLNGHTKSIIAKYRQKPHEATDFVLPVFSNQVMNRHYKELGKYCHIDRNQRVVCKEGILS